MALLVETVVITIRWAAPMARACAWVDAHLAAFKIVPSAAALLPSIKAVAELAHAADYLTRTADRGLAETGTRWLDFAWAETARGEIIRAVLAADPRFVPTAITYLPFHLSGRRNEALRQTIAAQVRAATMMPLGWAMTVPALRMLGLEATPAMEAAARKISVLAQRTDPARLPQDAAYLLAHECVYASAWGRRATDFAPATARYVEEALPALLARHLADADVVAELILAVHATSPVCVEAAAWQAIERAQDPSGKVNPTRELVTMFERLSHPVLERAYHTTLVAIMAWASCSHPCR